MRPISLTQMFRRIYETILLDYIESSTDTSALRNFHQGQAGFRKGYSSTTLALLSHEQSLRLPLHHAFLDFSGAYDTVPIPLLLSKMQDRQAPPGLISIIASLFLLQSSILVVNLERSPPVMRERGLFQGSILCTILVLCFY